MFTSNTITDVNINTNISRNRIDPFLTISSNPFPFIFAQWMRIKLTLILNRNRIILLFVYFWNLYILSRYLL